jgi:hypothetical protein
MAAPSDFVDEVRSDAASNMTDEPVLVVASGLQKGAKVRLPRGETCVGSDPACSVVVVDAVSGGKYLQISVDDAVKMQSDCRIVMGNGDAVQPGEVWDVMDSCTFSVGETSFQLELPRKQGKVAVERGSLSRAALPISAAIATLGSAALATLLLSGGEAPSRSVAHTLPSRAPGADAQTADLAVAFLQKRIDSSGLTRLSVGRQPDGTLSVRGELTATQERDWLGIRQQYDERFGSANVLVEQFGAPSSLPSVHIAAVWSGSNPYMVDDHGGRLRPGASVGDGWSIAKIDQENVVIRQGSRSVALRY